LQFDKKLERDFHKLDSFVIYICLEGEFEIEYPEGTENVKRGETVLIPAAMEQFFLKPKSPEVKLLEVHV
jgi:mannose-6-phosphate isomerase